MQHILTYFRYFVLKDFLTILVKTGLHILGWESMQWPLATEVGYVCVCSVEGRLERNGLALFKDLSTSSNRKGRLPAAAGRQPHPASLRRGRCSFLLPRRRSHPPQPVAAAHGRRRRRRREGRPFHRCRTRFSISQGRPWWPYSTP